MTTNILMDSHNMNWLDRVANSNDQTAGRLPAITGDRFMTREQQFLDGHKLMFHPERVGDWLNDKHIYPIYVEIGLVNRCNYRCAFCAFDYTDYRGEFIDAQVMLDTLSQMASCGVKSVMFAGTGEPLLHSSLAAFIRHASELGMDVALSTNGAMLDLDKASAILPYLSWIRISFNAGSADVYASIHGCDAAKFEQVLTHIQGCVAIKKELHLPVTIGVQSLILQENLAGMYDLGKRLRTIGVDYFTLKPYSKHPSSRTERINDPRPSITEQWLQEMESLTNAGPDSNFNVIIRKQAITSVLQTKKPYTKCYGLPFWSYIEADGEVYACNTFVGDRRFSYGNITRTSFKDIWASKNRLDIMESLINMDASQCRMGCRLDQVNKYLWELKNPHPHVNFI